MRLPVCSVARERSVGEDRAQPSHASLSRRSDSRPHHRRRSGKRLPRLKIRVSAPPRGIFRQLRRSDRFYKESHAEAQRRGQPFGAARYCDRSVGWTLRCSIMRCRRTLSRCGRRSPRDAARMLVVREDGSLAHAAVRDLPEYLRRGDMLVVNDSKVIPARLHVLKQVSGTAGPAIEILLHRRSASDRFLALARPARKLGPATDCNATVSARGCSRKASRRGGDRLRHRGRRAGRRHCGHRRDAAAALHRRQAQGRCARRRAIIRPCLRATKARWRRPPPACISRRSCLRRLDGEG